MIDSLIESLAELFDCACGPCPEELCTIDPANPTITHLGDLAITGYDISGVGTAAASVKAASFSAIQAGQIQQALLDGCVLIWRNESGLAQVAGGPWGGTFSGDVVNGGSLAVTGIDHTVDISTDPCADVYAQLLAQANDVGTPSGRNSVVVYCAV